MILPMTDPSPTCSECGLPLRARSKICLSCGHFQGSRGGHTGDDLRAMRPRPRNYRIVDIVWSPAEAGPVLAKTTPWWMIVLLAIAVCSGPLLVIFALPPDMVQRATQLKTGSVGGDLLVTLAIDLTQLFAGALVFWLMARSLGGHTTISEITKVTIIACLPLLLLIAAAGGAFLLRHPDCRSVFPRIGAAGILLYVASILPLAVWSTYLWYVSTRAICRFGHTPMIISTVVTLAVVLSANIFTGIGELRGPTLREDLIPDTYYEDIAPSRPTRWRSI